MCITYQERTSYLQATLPLSTARAGLTTLTRYDDTLARVRSSAFPTILSSSKSKPGLQAESEKHQRLKQGEQEQGAGAPMGHLGQPAGRRSGRQVAMAGSTRVVLRETESFAENQRALQSERQEQLKRKPTECRGQERRHGPGPVAGVTRRAWHLWRIMLRARSTGGMRVERFGLSFEAAVTPAPGKASEMLELLKQMGVTASAEATRKPSNDLLPLPLTFSAEENLWTEWASSEAPPSDKPSETVQKAGRRAWRWSLISGLNFLNYSALGSVKNASQLYPQGPLELLPGLGHP